MLYITNLYWISEFNKLSDDMAHDRLYLSAILGQSWTQIDKSSQIAVKLQDYFVQLYQQGFDMIGGGYRARSIMFIIRGLFDTHATQKPRIIVTLLDRHYDMNEPDQLIIACHANIWLEDFCFLCL